MVDNISILLHSEPYLISFANGNLHSEWDEHLDHRVKWYVTMLASFRKQMLDGKGIVVTDVLGLDMPRMYHKDGFAVDTRTYDMDRDVRLRLKKKAFDLRNECRILSESAKWRFGFDPHDDYEQHDPAWHREHFHIFVKDERVTNG